MKRIIVPLVIGAAVLAGGGAVTSAQATTPKPVIHFTGIRTHVTANSATAPAFKWSVAHFPAGWSIYIQRTYGSTYKWVKSLPKKTSGTVTAPKVPMGAYRYRLVARTKTRVIGVSAPVGAWSYGTVRIQNMCDPETYGDCTNNQVTQVGNTLFTTRNSTWAGTSSANRVPVFGSKGTRCRSMTFQMAGGDDLQRHGITVFLTFIQRATDPHNVAVPPGRVITYTVPTDGGPMTMNVTASDGNSDGLIANTWGSCYSTTVRR